MMTSQLGLACLICSLASSVILWFQPRYNLRNLLLLISMGCTVVYPGKTKLQRILFSSTHSTSKNKPCETKWKNQACTQATEKGCQWYKKSNNNKGPSFRRCKLSDKGSTVKNPDVPDICRCTGLKQHTWSSTTFSKYVYWLGLFNI